MKKSLLTLVLGFACFCMFSFTTNTLNHNSVKSKIVKIKKRDDCIANITSFTVLSISSSSVTFSWTYSGTPGYFVYGGYFNCRPSSSPSIAPTNVYLPSTTATVYYPSSSCYGGRVGVQCACSNSSPVGGTHGALWENGSVVMYF